MTDVRIPLDGTEDSFDLEVHLECMLCGRRMVRAPRHDKGKLPAFVCLGAHPSQPVPVEIKIKLDGTKPADA